MAEPRAGSIFAHGFSERPATAVRRERKRRRRRPAGEWSSNTRFADIVLSNFGFSVSISPQSSLPDPLFSAVGACPPHDGVRPRWWIATAVSLIGSSQKIGRSHHRHRPGKGDLCRLLRETFDLLIARYAATSFFDQLNSVPSTSYARDARVFPLNRLRTSPPSQTVFANHECKGTPHRPRRFM